MSANPNNKKKIRYAQSAVEYLLLLVAVTVVVMLAFKTLLPQNRIAAEGYVNEVAKGIYGRPTIGNGWDKLRKDQRNYP